jgi:predicted nucleic-acid-binding Zn-ribbon protein
MAYCPECDTTLAMGDDVEFVEMDAETGLLKASKRFYLVACGNCGAAIGGGVAGAKA